MFNEFSYFKIDFGLFITALMAVKVKGDAALN